MPRRAPVPFVDYAPCTAYTEKGKGPQCTRMPIRGGTVCPFHGGNAPQVRAAANKRLEGQDIERRMTRATKKVEADLEAMLAHEGVAVIDDPIGELSKLASSAKQLMLALGARVNAINEDGLEHFDAKESATIKAEVLLYERSMDRLARFLDMLVKNGYAERQIQIQESQAALVSGVVRRVISAMGLSAEQQGKAQTLLAEEFRALKDRATSNSAE